MTGHISDPAPEPDTGPLHLTAAEELFLETLAARWRLGEQLWPFGNRHRRTAGALERKGLIETQAGNVGGTFRASLTEAGRRQCLAAVYRPTAWGAGPAIPAAETGVQWALRRTAGDVGSLILDVTGENEARSMAATPGWPAPPDIVRRTVYYGPWEPTPPRTDEPPPEAPVHHYAAPGRKQTRCQHCTETIVQLESGIWVDTDGFVRCMKAPGPIPGTSATAVDHTPMPTLDDPR